MSAFGLEYYKNDQPISFETAMDLLDFQTIGMSVLFEGRLAANQFILYLDQGSRIDSVGTTNGKIGYDQSLKQATFQVSDIDFSRDAALVVQSKENNEVYKYSVHFPNYIR